MTTTTSVPAPVGVPQSRLEIWEMRVDGTIILNVLKSNRWNQPIEDLLTIGPNRKGSRFEISEEDRKDNQRRVAAVEHDPFKNGMLLRVDEDQQETPETASAAVLTDDDYLEIIDLPEDEFRKRVTELPEVPVRALRNLAEGAGASHGKVVWLDEHINERFMPGGPQKGIQDDGAAEKLS